MEELAEKGFAARKDGGAKLWKVGRRELGAAVVKVSLASPRFGSLKLTTDPACRGWMEGPLFRVPWLSHILLGSRSSRLAALEVSTGAPRRVSRILAEQAETSPRSPVPSLAGFDISSDLISLSDTPVAVICAGSKSILDIGLTLEYLEAHAVPVAAYGTLDWPAFYTPTSGFKVRPSALCHRAELTYLCFAGADAARQRTSGRRDYQ